jgi:hypothetical protein
VSLAPGWWRGYRGCASPPEVGGEDGRQLEPYVPPVRDKRDRIVRQVPLVISHQHVDGAVAQEACRRDLDVLIDACGPMRICIRHLGLRVSMQAGKRGPATAVLRLSVYLIEQAAEAA